LLALERCFENFKREGRVYVVFSSSLRHEKEGKTEKGEGEVPILGALLPPRRRRSGVEEDERISLSF